MKDIVFKVVEMLKKGTRHDTQRYVISVAKYSEALKKNEPRVKRIEKTMSKIIKGTIGKSVPYDESFSKYYDEWDFLRPVDHSVTPKSIFYTVEGFPLNEATDTKTDKVRKLVADENYLEALKITKTFRMLKPADKTDLQRAYEASVRPDFYRQIGKNPDSLIAQGIEVLKKLYT